MIPTSTIWFQNLIITKIDTFRIIHFLRGKNFAQSCKTAKLQISTSLEPTLNSTINSWIWPYFRYAVDPGPVVTGLGAHIIPGLGFCGSLLAVCCWLPWLRSAENGTQVTNTSNRAVSWPQRGYGVWWYHGKGSNDWGSNDQGSNCLRIERPGAEFYYIVRLERRTPSVKRRAPNNERQIALTLEQTGRRIIIPDNL
jgi:hypothetical protein